MTWLKDALERRTLWPYRIYENQVRAHFKGQLLRDGECIGKPFSGQNYKLSRKRVVDAGIRWELFSEAEEWNEILLELTLSVEDPEQFRNQVFSSRRSVYCFFAVDAVCKNTRWRLAKTAPLGVDKGVIRFELVREHLSGDVILTPLVILGEDLQDAKPKFARLKGSRLATGFPVHILVDPPQPKPGGGIEIVWTKFPQEVSDSLVELTIDSPHPVLKVNNQHPSLKVIFEDQSKTGNRAKIRNALFSLIATDVWMQLAEFAASTERLGLDDEDDPSVVLSRKILKALTRMLKCHAADVMGAFDDPSSRTELNLRLQHALKTLTHQNALITGLVSDGETEQGS